MNETWIPVLALAAYLAPWLFFQVRRGVYTSRTFDDAPTRLGDLGWVDLLIALALWLGGNVLAAEALEGLRVEASSPAGGDATRELPMHEPGVAIGVMAIGVVAWLPAIGYVLLRAKFAVERGLDGFGLGLRRPGRTIGFTIAGALFIIPATLLALNGSALVVRALGVETPTIAHKLLEEFAAFPREQQVQFGLMAVILAPLIEEVFFRGLFQTGLKGSGLGHRPWLAIVVASAFFTVIHLGAVPWVALPGLFVLSVGLGYTYEKTGSLVPPILIHAAFNGLNVAAVAYGWAGE